LSLLLKRNCGNWVVLAKSQALNCLDLPFVPVYATRLAVTARGTNSFLHVIRAPPATSASYMLYLVALTHRSSTLDQAITQQAR